MSSTAEQDVSPTAEQVVGAADLSGKTVVITGATSGLGRESARVLAGAGAHVVLTGRDREGLAATRDRIHTDAPAARTSVVELDLTSLASIRSAARAIAEAAPVIDILMNNAGVMFTPLGRTGDGFELQFGTNHLGHFELTRLLQPQLEAAGTARIVNLSSDGHRIADIDLDDPNWQRREYDKFKAYGAAKTANVLHAVELDRRLRDRGVRAYAVHPGVVATNLARYMSREDLAALSERTGGRILQPLTPEQGAATQVWACVSPELAETGGVYLADCRIRDAAPYALDEARAARLWELSETLTGAA